jgi:hypothetical protein
MYALAINIGNSSLLGALASDPLSIYFMQPKSERPVGQSLDVFETIDGQSDPAASSSAHAAQFLHPHQIRAQEKARQAARIRRFLIASLFSALYLMALAIFYSQSLVDRTTFFAVTVVVSVAMAVFYGIFATSINQKAKEKNLTAPIVVCALATMLGMVYFAPITRIIFAPFVSLTIAYGDVPTFTKNHAAIKHRHARRLCAGDKSALSAHA